MRTSQPFFVHGIRVGTVTNVESHPSFQRGTLTLDDCAERLRFETVVALARKVDLSTSEEYQSSWATWMRGCEELQDLRLTIGDGQTRIEEFTIESDWSIEWRDMNGIELD